MTTYIATTQAPPQNVTVVVSNQDRFIRQQKQSVIAAWFLFFAGGMELALGLGWNAQYTAWAFQYSWFIAFICGAIITSPFIRMLPKVGYYGFGSLMVLVAGIIYTSVPYHYEAAVAARCLSGLGVGAITMPYMVHVGEISSRYTRGSCAGLEQAGYTFGIAVEVIYASQWTSYTEMPPMRFQGILFIVFSIFALGCLPRAVESPVFYMLRNNDARALATQTSLLPNYTPPEVAQAAFDELKAYVVESDRTSPIESVFAFVKLLFYRCFLAFCFSLPLNAAMVATTLESKGYTDSWPPIVYGILRFIGGLFGVSFMDTIGRRMSSLVSLTVVAGLLLAVAIYIYESTWLYGWVICRIIMTISFFAGVFAPSTTTYLTEAFSLKLKPFYIVLIVCIEQLIHIIVILSSVNSYTYFLTVSIIMLVAVVFYVVVLPETRGLSLLEAQRRFRSSNHMRAY